MTNLLQIFATHRAAALRAKNKALCTANYSIQETTVLLLVWKGYSDNFV